jgi:hypothetical protein
MLIDNFGIISQVEYGENNTANSRLKSLKIFLNPKRENGKEYSRGQTIPVRRLDAPAL